MERLAIILVISLFSQFASVLKGEIIDVEKGILKTKLMGLPSGVETLEISGELTEEEQAYFRLIPKSVVNLDISKLKFESHELAPFAFFNSTIKQIKLPADLKGIGEWCFAQSSISSIILPSSISELGEGAFYNCRDLKSVDASSSQLTCICGETFKDCNSLQEIHFPRSISEVGDRAFMGSKLKSVNFPNVKVLGAYAFAEMTELVEVMFPTDCRIGEGLFFGDNQFSAVPELNSYPPLVLAGTHQSDKEIRIESDVVGDGALANTSIDKIILSENVRRIDVNAFRNLKNLKIVDVTALGNLIPETASDAFSGVAVGSVILITAPGVSSFWASHPVWGDFNVITSGIDMPEDKELMTEYILNGAFLTIQCNQMIEKIRIFDVAGEVLVDSNPGKNQFTARLNTGNKIYIIEIIAGNKKLIKKIINGKE